MPDTEGGRVTTLTSQAGRMRQGYSFSIYGAGLPLAPVVDGQDPRQWDFSPGFNTISTPRHSEPFSFAHLRAFANVELVRMAIETRKDQLERLNWKIKPRDTKAARSKETDPRCLEAEKFFAKPDGMMHFGSFFRALDEDLLALDAQCMELRRTRGGKLFGLDLVDGATINLVIDDQGRRPREPDAIAFQQIIRGVVFANLGNRDLIYAPRNVRSGHIYGFSPVEQIVVSINTIIQRQASQLAYFTDGNVPAGILNAPAGYNNDQIRDLQQWFDQRLGGNVGAKRKLIWAPAESKYAAFKDAPIKDEFDEWLARVVAFAFSLPPTPFVRQMNKGTAGEDQDRALEEGLEPLKLHRKRLMDSLLAEEFGWPDLEFAWEEDIDIDPTKQAEIDNIRLRNMSATLDEVRDRAGDDPLPDGLGAKPFFYATDGPVPMDQIEALIARKTAPPPAPVIAPAGNAPPPKPGKQPAAKLEKAARIPPPAALALSIDRPKAMRARAALARAIAPILAKAAHDIAAQVERKIEKAERDPKIEAGKIAGAIDFKILLGLNDPLEAELEAIADDAGGLALGAIGVDEASALFDQVNPGAVAYAKDRAAELLSLDGEQSLIESTRGMVRGIIASGLEDNIGRDAIADSIQSAAAFSEFRAELIADTEIAFANSAGKKGAWDSAQADGAQMVKEWFVSGDEGVCPICEDNEAQGEIAYDAPFDSGDDMEPAHPACRCVTTARVLDPGESGASGD